MTINLEQDRSDSLQKPINTTFDNYRNSSDMQI